VGQGVKRKYRSAVREAAAVETASRIRAAAAELFVAQGFAATTLKQVAERAGVGERTVYDIYGGKLRLLNHTIGLLAVPDADRTPLAHRDDVRAAREHDDPREAVALTVAGQAETMERAGDLILVGEEAGRHDREIADKARRGYERAREVFTLLAERLEAREELRDGLDAETASDVMFALGSPQMFDILRRRRGWSAEKYVGWLVGAAQREVLPLSPLVEEER
jgi:AcrR family transcriptional regulator